MSRERPAGTELEKCVVRVKYFKKGPTQFFCEEVSVEYLDYEADVPSRYAEPVFRDKNNCEVSDALKLSAPATLRISVYDAAAVDWHQDGDTNEAEMRCHKALRERGGFLFDKKGGAAIPEGQCCPSCDLTKR